MKTTLPYKVAGTLAAVLTLSAFGAIAQDAMTPAAPAMPAAQAAPSAPTDAAAPAQAPAVPGAMAPAAAAPGAVAAASGPSAKDFVQKAFLNNEFGIAASQVALQQSQSPAAKSAAQQVLSDGMKTRTAMVTAIQAATTDMHFSQDWTDDYKQKLADLQSSTGKDFDQKYLSTQASITQQSQGIFSDYAQNGTDASVKTFAVNTVPTLQSDNTKIEAAISAADSEAAAAPEAATTTKKTTTHKATTTHKTTAGTR